MYHLRDALLRQRQQGATARALRRRTAADDVDRPRRRSGLRRSRSVSASTAGAHPERAALDRASFGAQVALRIDAEWREEERIGFRVRLADGSSWLLYYVPELDLWSGIADAGAWLVREQR